MWILNIDVLSRWSFSSLNNSIRVCRQLSAQFPLLFLYSLEDNLISQSLISIQLGQAALRPNHTEVFRRVSQRRAGLPMSFPPCLIYPLPSFTLKHNECSWTTNNTAIYRLLVSYTYCVCLSVSIKVQCNFVYMKSILQTFTSHRFGAIPLTYFN